MGGVRCELRTNGPVILERARFLSSAHHDASGWSGGIVPEASIEVAPKKWR